MALCYSVAEYCTPVWSCSPHTGLVDVPHCQPCPLLKLNGGLSQLHSAVNEAVAWLISYGSSCICKKKISTTQVCSRFLICCSTFKLERLEGEWGRKFEQNFTLIDQL